MGPESKNRWPYRKRRGHPKTPRDECLITTEAEAGDVQPQAKEQHGLMGNSRSWERNMRQTSRRNQHLPAP